MQAVRVNATPGVGSEEKHFIQFLADNEFIELFEEVKSLLAQTGKHVSIADVMKVALQEYRNRHSPIARQERRAARIGAASLDSRRRERTDAARFARNRDQTGAAGGAQSSARSQSCARRDAWRMIRRR